MPDQGMTRRTLLRTTGAGLLTVGGGGLVAGCGGGGAAGPRVGTGGDAAARPQRGGTLIFGGQGGADTDTLDAHNALTNTDFARLSQLYDALVRMDSHGRPQLAMAESITPNKDATEWTIALRRGLEVHDGSAFVARDVLYSFKRILKNKYPGTFALGPIDLAQSHAPDARTVKLRFKRPYSILMDALSLHWYLYMVPAGYDPRRPVGTGPFKLVSFSPGQSSTTIRFDAYWDHPRPYLDKVVTNNISDETAQTNALRAGQVNAINYLTAASIPALRSERSVKLIISKSAGFEPFTMRVDAPPYDDPRVRTALKLSVDRKQMLDSLFAGYGRVGNDVFSVADRRYDPSLFGQREQDLEQAKSLLKAAGHPNLSVQLVTTPNAPGMVQAAEVFATQAGGANVRTKVVNQTTTQYFARSYLKVPFSEDYWQFSPYLITAGQATVTGAPYNSTHQADPAYDKLFAEATRTLDPALQAEIVHEMMRYDHEKGGFLIPFFFPVIDAVAADVHGVQPAVTGQALDTYNFKNFWMA
jgi:peptide/nickel transport system substrate-binding protein